MDEKKIWTTQYNEEIEISKMDDQHLINTIKWIEKNAKEGVTELYGHIDPFLADCYDNFVEGERYLKSVHEYPWLIDEAKKRNLKIN